MSAVSKLKAKLGAKDTADIIQHPASKADGENTGERIEVPVDVAREVEAAVNMQQADKVQQTLTQVIATLNCAQDQYGGFVVSAPIGQRIETVNIDSSVGEDAIRAKMKDASGKMPPKSLMDNIKAEIRIGARHAGRQVKTHRRVACSEGTYSIDLGDATGRVVKISNGQWDVVGGGDIAFIRQRGYAALPEPVRPQSSRQGLILLLQLIERLGVPKSRAPLVIVLLVCWLKEGVTYPVLALYGAPGGGKSTAALQLLMLVDPPATGQLPNIAQSVDHIAAAAQARHILTIDNASKFSAELQDILCTCSTGGEILQRELYTNGGVVVLPIHRGVMVTSVSPVITRPDLMSRTIPVEFTPREDRRSVAELMDEFNAHSSELFGALVELVAASTAPLAGENSQGHRLHDFCIAGQRIFAAAGLKPSQFMDLMNRMRASTGAEIAAGDSFVTAVRKVLDELATRATDGEALPGWKTWFPTGYAAVRRTDGHVVIGVRPKGLFALLRGQIAPINTDGWMPRNEREMGNALLRSTPILSDVSVNVTKREPSSGNAYWEFTLRDVQADADVYA